MPSLMSLKMSLKEKISKVMKLINWGQELLGLARNQLKSFWLDKTAQKKEIVHGIVLWRLEMPNVAVLLKAVVMDSFNSPLFWGRRLTAAIWKHAEHKWTPLEQRRANPKK